MIKVNSGFFAVRAVEETLKKGHCLALDHVTKRKLLSLSPGSARISVVTKFSQEGRPSP
jgi:hypothetical protein